MDAKNKSFRELYLDAVNTPIPPTPRDAFLQRMAEVTGCSIHTVYAWAREKKRPSASAAKLVSQELGIDRHILFPELEAKE